MFNANQGTKDTSQQWNYLLASVFDDYNIMLLFLVKDDCFVTVPYPKYAEDSRLYLKQYFNLTIQKGPILKFLGLHIVQTDHTISVDQSESIFDILQKYFGSDIDCIKTSSTPMIYNSGYKYHWMKKS